VWAAGDACSALWREDGRFYPARVQVVLADGRCRVEFLGYGDVETLAPGDLRNASQDARAGGPPPQRVAVTPPVRR
jgi:hypothetical protein